MDFNMEFSLWDGPLVLNNQAICFSKDRLLILDDLHIVLYVWRPVAPFTNMV